MKKLTWAELFSILANFVGTTFINIHSVTPNKGQFNEGKDGSRKHADRMINHLGHTAKDIRKEQSRNFMLTSCGFDKLIENAKKRLMDAELALLGINVDDFIKSVSFMRSDEFGYKLDERKNGESVNGYLVRSKKDEHPMINVYPSLKNIPSPRFFNVTNNEDISKETLKPYKSASYGKPSKKQIEFGLNPDTSVRINNFRFENIRHITMNGTRYEIVKE